MRLGQLEINNTVAHIKQEFVRPRWPYDMRSSVRAESTSVTLAGPTLPMVTITGRTDRQTDRQSATQYAAPS